MASTKDTLRQVFPHITGAAIDEVVDGLSAEFENQPERLLYRATSELLRGNFTLNNPNGANAVEVVDADAAAPKPHRDLVSEKAEVLAFIEGMAPNVDMKWLSKHYETFVLNGDKRLRSKDHIQGLLANYILEHSDYPKKTTTSVKAATTTTDYTKYDTEITSADYRTQWYVNLSESFFVAILSAYSGGISSYLKS